MCQGWLGGSARRADGSRVVVEHAAGGVAGVVRVVEIEDRRGGSMGARRPRIEPGPGWRRGARVITPVGSAAVAEVMRGARAHGGHTVIPKACPGTARRVPARAVVLDLNRVPDAEGGHADAEVQVNAVVRGIGPRHAPRDTREVQASLGAAEAGRLEANPFVMAVGDVASDVEIDPDIHV